MPGSEMPSSKVSLPSGVTGTFMKKLMLLAMSRFSKAVIEGDDGLQEALPAGMHVALFDGVADHVAFGGAGAAERIVAATRVSDDGQQRVAVGGD